MDGQGSSRFRRVLYSDGTRGGGWLRWALIAHAMFIAGVIAAVTSDTSIDVLISIGVMIAGLLGSVCFWIMLRRTWSKAADPTYGSTAEGATRE